MFCTSLRRRPSTTDLVPSITSPAPNGLHLKESNLTTHDLSIPLPNPRDAKTKTPPPRLLLLILTPSQTARPNLQSTLSRIHHFTSLTGGTNCAIIFHLQPSTTSNTPTSGLQSYTTLTTHLLFPTSSTSTPTHAPPILLLSSASALPQLLTSYIRALTTPQPGNRPAHTVNSTANSAYDLLPYCSVNAPLPGNAVSALSDAFVDLRDLVKGAVDEVGTEQSSSEVEDGSGVQGLERCLGGKEGADVREFWREEWVAE